MREVVSIINSVISPEKHHTSNDINIEKRDLQTPHSNSDKRSSDINDNLLLDNISNTIGSEDDLLLDNISSTIG
jgi:hypothetical protein